MSERKPEFAMWFHKFLIYGMLWICGIGLIAIGIQNTCIAIEDGVSPLILVILMQVILAASGAAIIKARFDLAKMKASGLKLLLSACWGIAIYRYYRQFDVLK